MNTLRTRAAAIAGGMALTMSLALAPAVMAQQDTPEDTIRSFMDAVAAKDFEALPGYFCLDQAAQAAQFDISALAGEMPEGMDVQSLLDAFIFDIQLDSVDVVSQTDTEAVVSVSGSMGMDIDAEALVPFVTNIIEMSGMEADEATVDMFMGMVTAEFESQTEDIDADITLVPNDEGQWQICSDLSFGESALMGEEASAAPADVDDGMTDNSMAAEASASPAAGE
jgi:hypothetical protein